MSHRGARSRAGKYSGWSRTVVARFYCRGGLGRESPRGKTISDRLTSFGRFAVHLHDVFEDFGVRKILVINDIRFARHAEVLDGERNEFPFPDLAVARAARENGHAEVAFHKDP